MHTSQPFEGCHASAKAKLNKSKTHLAFVPAELFCLGNLATYPSADGASPTVSRHTVSNVYYLPRSRGVEAISLPSTSSHPPLVLPTSYTCSLSVGFAGVMKITA